MESLKNVLDLIPLLDPYRTWVKVLVGAWFVFTLVVILVLIFAQRTFAKLQVTDILLEAHRAEHNAVVDFRLLNRGDKTLTISRVRFEVLSVEETWVLGGFQSSAKYDLDISELAQTGQHAEVAVSHVLAADQPDRFLIVLTARHMPEGTVRTWRLKPVLVTSEGESEAPLITVRLPHVFQDNP